MPLVTGSRHILTVVVKRTSLNLDLDLVREAADVLGTDRTTDTIHGALADVVQRRRRRSLTEHEFPGLTLDSLDEMRRPRAAANRSR
jgi:Arc/MetJ family transcription regulator